MLRVCSALRVQACAQPALFESFEGRFSQGRMSNKAIANSPSFKPRNQACCCCQQRNRSGVTSCGKSRDRALASERARIHGRISIMYKCPRIFSTDNSYAAWLPGHRSSLWKVFLKLHACSLLPFSLSLWLPTSKLPSPSLSGRLALGQTSSLDAPRNFGFDRSGSRDGFEPARNRLAEM